MRLTVDPDIGVQTTARAENLQDISTTYATNLVLFKLCSMYQEWSVVKDMAEVRDKIQKIFITNARF